MKRPVQLEEAILSQSLGHPWPPGFPFRGSRSRSGLRGAYSLTSPTATPQPAAGLAMG